MSESRAQNDPQLPRDGTAGTAPSGFQDPGRESAPQAGGGERREATGGPGGAQDRPDGGSAGSSGSAQGNSPGRPGEGDGEALGQRLRSRLHEDRELALWMRALLFLVGWLLVLLGIAGLVLPGIQGIITLVAGAAVLSLASELAYKSLRWCFRVWPRGWRRVARWRLKLRKKLVQHGGGRKRKPAADQEEVDPGTDDPRTGQGAGRAPPP